MVPKIVTEIDSAAEYKCLIISWSFEYWFCVNAIEVIVYVTV